MAAAVRQGRMGRIRCLLALWLSVAVLAFIIMMVAMAVRVGELLLRLRTSKTVDGWFSGMAT